jgi:hypothetical protein
MKSTGMGREVPKHKLEFLTCPPDVTLGCKDDVKDTGFHLCEPLAHAKPNAAYPHVVLPKRHLEMPLLLTYEGWCAGQLYAARQQHRLRITFTEGFELLDELQQWLIDLLQANLRIDGEQRRAVHPG